MTDGDKLIDKSIQRNKYWMDAIEENKTTKNNVNKTVW